MLLFFKLIIIFFLFSFFNPAYPKSTKTLMPREPFKFNLAKISLYFPDKSQMPEYVRISFDNDKDYVIITPTDDSYVKNTRKGTERTTYRESFDKAYYMSDFEAKQINLVCKTFVSTLKEFENNIRNEKWERCLYLDSFFPRFLRGFYFLVCAAKNSLDVLSKECLVPEKAFDVSLKSPKSDIRINHWRKTDDYCVKLRIITNELIYQIEQWQKNELTKKNRNPEVSYLSKLDETLKMFINIYFIKSAPVSDRNNIKRR